MFLLFIGFILVIPNISFFSVALYVIRMKERNSFSDAVSMAYRLTIENYWTTWVTVFVASLIIAVIIGVGAFITGILVALQAFNTTTNIYNNPESFGWLSVVSFVFEFLGQFFHVIFYLIVILWFFSLYEKKYAVGIQQKLEEIGNVTDNDSDNEQPLII